MGVILGFGAWHALNGRASVGTIVLFVQFSDMLFRPIINLGDQYNALARAAPARDRIFRLLDWTEALRVPAMPAPLPAKLRGDILLRKLSFGYKADAPILKSVGDRPRECHPRQSQRHPGARDRSGAPGPCAGLHRSPSARLGYARRVPRRPVARAAAIARFRAGYRARSRDSHSRRSNRQHRRRNRTADPVGHARNAGGAHHDHHRPSLANDPRSVPHRRARSGPHRRIRDARRLDRSGRSLPQTP